MKLYADAYALCHIGNVRRNNEDNFYLQGRMRAQVDQEIAGAAYFGSARRFLAAVADGMGGTQRGEIASWIAVRNLHTAALEEIEQDAWRSVQRANEEICMQMQESGARMGSTLTALYLADGKAVCVNVGDSRVYRLRNGQLMRLTKDHSKAQQLIDLNILTPEQAQAHPSRHELTRHLGIFPEEMELEPDMGEAMDVQAGDRFLLCSDGLYDALIDAQIEEMMCAQASPQQITERLTEQALEAGSRDNVTAMIVEIKDRMEISKWTRAIIRNMNRSSVCGK